MINKTKLLLLIPLLTQTLFSAIDEEGNESPDKRTLYHLGISFTIGYMSETILHQSDSLNDAGKILLASIPAIGVGVAKEFKDEQGEKGDIIANILGSLAGAYISNTLNNNYFFEVEHKLSTKMTKLNVGYKF